MSKNDDCLTLKNINYQTMLLNRNSTINVDKDETSNIDTYLLKEQEMIGAGKKPWNKLEKITKINKLNEFVDDFSKTEDISIEISAEIKRYLRTSLERKRLQRIKDVTYDALKGKIVKIPGFTYNKKNNKYALRRVDKKNSISKSLAPQKQKTKRKKSRRKKRLEKRDKTNKNKPHKNKSNRKKSPLNKTNKRKKKEKKNKSE